jgi:hypothetical protein
MFSTSDLSRLILLDIETATIAPTMDLLNDRLRDQWAKKAKTLQKTTQEEKSAEEWFLDRGAIFAEFSQVVCVSVGFLTFSEERPHCRVTSAFGPEEHAVLASFDRLLARFEPSQSWRLCAHNGKEFDFPFLGRRFLVNGLPLPALLQLQGKKPWEIPHVDTMDLWKFGDYKSYVSLDLLTAILDVPSPKSDLKGSEVGRVFWQDRDYDRIRRYCEQDVVATAQVLLRFSRLPILNEKEVVSLSLQGED